MDRKPLAKRPMNGSIDPSLERKPLLQRRKLLVRRPVNDTEFEERDTVRDIGIKGRTARVLKKGIEVSEVQWPDGTKQFIGNDNLRRA